MISACALSAESPSVSVFPQVLEGDTWTEKLDFSFASNSNGLLDRGLLAQDNLANNCVHNSTYEGSVSGDEVLARLKAAFWRERAASKCQVKRLELLSQHMNERLPTLTVARSGGTSKGIGPAQDQQTDLIVGLSKFVADLLQAGRRLVEEEPEPIGFEELADEWALLFDTRTPPGLDSSEGVNKISEGIAKDVGDKLLSLGGLKNAPGWELGMQQLGHLLDIGVSIDTLPGHSRRSALLETPFPKPAGELAGQEWADGDKWLEDNASKILKPKAKYRCRDDSDHAVGLDRARRRVLSMIGHDPTIWAALCAGYERLPRRTYDRHADGRDLEAVGWLVELAEKPADERDRQIVLCWFREGLSDREFARAKGLSRSTFRDILARHCKLIAERLNARK